MMTHLAENPLTNVHNLPLWVELSSLCRVALQLGEIIAGGNDAGLTMAPKEKCTLG